MNKKRIQHSDLRAGQQLVLKTDTTHDITVRSSRDTRDGILYTIHDPRASSPVSQERVVDLRFFRDYYWLK